MGELNEATFTEVMNIGSPLCFYDGTQESVDNCVAVMAKDLGIERGEDGKFSGELIMVGLWARMLRLEQKALESV